jgi:hypothetical protein
MLSKLSTIRKLRTTIYRDEFWLLIDLTSDWMSDEFPVYKGTGLGTVEYCLHQSEYAKRGDGMTSRNVHGGVYISYREPPNINPPSFENALYCTHCHVGSLDLENNAQRAQHKIFHLHTMTTR